MKTGISKRQSSNIGQSPFSNLFSRNFFDDLMGQYLLENNNQMPQMMQVSMDVAETDQAFEVKVDLPGINPDDVEIQIENNTLIIRGQRNEESEERDEDKQFHRIERYKGNFARSVVLPNSINEDETAAEFKDGVLKVVVPKSDEAKPRRIAITS